MTDSQSLLQAQELLNQQRCGYEGDENGDPSRHAPYQEEIFHKLLGESFANERDVDQIVLIVFGHGVKNQIDS